MKDTDKLKKKTKANIYIYIFLCVGLPTIYWSISYYNIV